MASLTLTRATKSFERLTVIHGVDLEIADGEFVVLVGPSGCGKSTLLRMIAGLEDITAGKLTIDGQDVTDLAPSKRGIAMVFQSYALYPHMNVARNIGFALETAGMRRAEIAERVRQVAGQLKIEHLLDRRPRQLSGGQRQRVAIGRALVRSPKVFLFDEPLSNLDADLRTEMRAELARLHQDIGTTMIYVTHDQVEAMTLADRIVVLHDGRIEQTGTPAALYADPANLFVARFIGSPRMNILSREDCPGAATLPGATQTGIRPEALRLSDTGRLRGHIDRVEALGHETLVHVRLATGNTLCLRMAPVVLPHAGAEVGLDWDDSAAFHFAADGARIRDAHP